MGKRYYCDYCDKSFADNPTSRKTHLTGISHLQIRKAHYDSLRSEDEILNDDKNKKPCRAFLSTGECKFGERCQFSHLTNEDRARLSEIITQKKQSVQTRLSEQSTGNSRPDLKDTLEKWVANRSKRQKLEIDLKDKPSQSKDPPVPDYKLADCLLSIPHLPPSLLPPSKDKILNSQFAEWGW